LVGAYVLNEDNKARYIVFDADDKDQFNTLRMINRDLPSYLEDSRRGGHLWLFFDQQQPGSTARSFGLGLMKAYGSDMELFPKQGQSDGPGSLIRVPFGIHRKTSERYPFIGKGNWIQQMDQLMNPETITSDMVARISFAEKTRSLGPDSNLPWERVKSSISVYDFVSQYVDLNGEVGRCPFHEDDHPSFGVSKDGNYWNCFAGCGGGSVIDFWMTWRGVDFMTATKELADMLGVDDG
jgi:hypothetical protein